MNSSGGMVLLNKPPGITSFNALGKIKKELGTKKVGHTGTLDKFAEGLIVALTGKMTKLVPQFTGMDKKYEALIHFGQETETLDPEGQIVAEAPVPSIEAIKESISLFLGKIQQKPPAFSAVHINGKRAYERVRSGEEVIMPTREIEIFSFEILSWESPYLRVAIHCSKGTYIRSLARDLAIACNSRAYLKELKRTSVGPFSLSDAVSAESFNGNKHLLGSLTIIDALPKIKKITVDQTLINDISMGKMSVLEELASQIIIDGEYALFDDNGAFLALAIRIEGKSSYRFVC